ncbi:hypothetical protein CHS0354_004808 [Potamilus streckersoni]|uniref:CCHC-type domain-containing protein n=1 Tax=Potamilus streckersoni TaxID=2493646 RepID=A0AAE0S8W3_9BIVA|nr:hypothetical protein CHS0354_004808 [Potamilus streckersoni]
MASSPDSEISFKCVKEPELNESGQGDAVQTDDEFSDAVENDELIPYERNGFHDAEEDDDILRGRKGRDGPHSERPMVMSGEYLSPVSGRFYMKPDHFSEDEDWDEYISHFESCAKLGRWSLEEKVLTLAACLRGVARTFYVSLTTTENSSYSMLIKKLQQRFGNSQPQSKWLALLESRARKSDESIVALGGDLRQLAQKAYSNIDAKFQEILASNQLFRILPYEMKCRCIDRECKTVDEALEVVQRKLQKVFEHLDRLEKKGLNPFGHNRSFSSHQQGNKVCFLCKSADHFFRKCPLYNKNKAENGGYRRDQRKRDVVPNDNKFNQQIQGNDSPLAV